MSSTSETSKDELLFSVIVPVRNDKQNIAKCLSGLFKMQFPPERFEIIVVDNGSNDGTREFVAEYANTGRLRVLDRPGVYISAVRNAGAAVAKGKYLAFLDSDCEVKADWLSQASAAISAGVGHAFGSYYLIPEASSWVARHWYEERDKKKRGEILSLPSGDLFVSSELFCKVGGFDETIQTNEDYELCQRIRSSGHPIICIPELAVIHWGTPQSLGQFYGKHRWHGMHVFRVFLRSLPKLVNFKPVALAVYTIVCALGILAGVANAVAGGGFNILAYFLLALLAPPLILGALAAITARRPTTVLPLASLYLVYAVARASSILDWRNWISRPKQEAAFSRAEIKSGKNKN
jgi:glycosyltransferase involved in cell wall biosynthesis